MGLSPSELLAIGRLEDYNPNRFDPSTNPRGLAGEGYKTNGTQAWNDTAEIGNAVARLAGEADTDATAASASASAAAASAVTAGTARDQAVAAAASSDFPYGTTAGTASAYTLDLTPDRVTGSGSACRVRFHVANNATPTLQVDAGAAAEIVDATGRSLAAGEIALNRVYILVYDGALSKWVIQSLPIGDNTITTDKINNGAVTSEKIATGVTINAKAASVSFTGTSKTLTLSDGNTYQNCSNAATQTVTIPLNSSVPIPVGDWITFERHGVGEVNIVATSGVTIRGVNAATISIAEQWQAIMIRKISTDGWIAYGALL